MKTARPTEIRAQRAGSKLSKMFIGAIFAGVLVLSRILHLRRSPGSWTAFRVILGFAGAGLVVLPLSLWNSYLLPVAGLGMFAAAILLPPAKPDTSVDDRARALGALVVVNGGRYQPGNAGATAARLFVGSEHIWALDSHLQPLLVIPIAEITSAAAERGEDEWHLRIRWADRAAEFSYTGVFGEHLARVAESTLRGVVRPALPVLPQRRAAGA
ncbi:MAG TPA: hypothetical protein VFA13_01655 [Candidatus Acidoferrum sp.]|nr:hypothetical protein [Candidatus Acidoferrum sp.]